MVWIGAGMVNGGLLTRAMTEADARAVAVWRYPAEYSFYDVDSDAADLAELLDPAEWGRRYFSVDDDGSELVGFFVFKVSGRTAEIGLALRPDLTGIGLGESFVDTAVQFAAERFGVESFTLSVAAFNVRAIKVYERTGFREVERYDHSTNGGVHAFIRMSRAPSAIVSDPAGG